MPKVAAAAGAAKGDTEAVPRKHLQVDASFSYRQASTYELLCHFVACQALDESQGPRLLGRNVSGTARVWMLRYRKRPVTRGSTVKLDEIGLCNAWFMICNLVSG